MAVADYVIAHGFDLMALNLRLGALELDVVARRGNLVIVAEVRTRGRGSLQGPFESISQAKRKRVLRAVDRLWQERLAAMRDVERIRIDAAAVTFDRGQTFVEYVAGAIVG